MLRVRTRSCAWTALLLLVLSAPARAEVSRVEVTSRSDVLGGQPFGSSGPYELIVARVHLSVDPGHERNRIVADLDKAPKNAAGKVEFVTDLQMLRPRDASLGNGIALIEIPNRGRKGAVGSFNRTPGTARTADAEYGDGFLMRRGYTIVWIGWEFDLPAREGVVRIDVPAATGIKGLARAYFVPSERRVDFTVNDLYGYKPSDPAAPENKLTVRNGVGDQQTLIPRERWSLAGNVVTLEGGFEPGRTYELTYAASDPPVAGLGFAAVRDTAAWIKYAADSPAPVKYAFTYGSSQSGRFLRDYVYQGFNTDERNRQVFDAVMAHVSGSARTGLNARWSTPTSQSMHEATAFPFADSAQRDPVTGAVEGLLDNPRARAHQPKIFYTNSDVEYWGGGRVAALVHTSPDGTKDLALPDNVRFYFFAGSQHSPARLPAPVTGGQQQENPNNYWGAMRALLVSMERWVRQGTAPPPSRHPRLRDGTLVRVGEVAFPTIPGVSSPKGLPAGPRAANPLLPRDGGPGATMPMLVPQVDRDGNDRAGLRLPEIAVPLGTYVGWNFRNPKIGGTDQLFPLIGAYMPFARTKAERERTGDPRPSIEERYPTRDHYLIQVRKSAESLAKEGYLLPEDVPGVVEQAGQHWDLLTMPQVVPTGATAEAPGAGNR